MHVKIADALSNGQEFMDPDTHSFSLQRFIFIWVILHFGTSVKIGLTIFNKPKPPRPH